MKIAWVTPLLARSAIGRESVRIADALAARGLDVTLIGSEAERPDEPLHSTQLATSYWRDIPLETLPTIFDAVVVNLGDNYAFHAGAFPILEAAPCIGVFHDFYLHNLFNGWLHYTGQAPGVREAVIATAYGPDAGPLAAPSARGEMDLEELAARLPMTEWVAAKCAGALIHARFYESRVTQTCPGPVAMARLPVAARGVAPLRARRRERLKVLTVGVMNPNKCVEHVIGAIGASEPLRERLEYRLAGPIAPEAKARLEGVAAAAGLSSLTVLGAVDEATLEKELAQADIICCLRRPVLEGSSGSAIEGLLSGRPVIVADAGFYSELPDDLVFKVPADVRQASLSATLMRLAADEELRRKTGARAQRWAMNAFRLEQYVEGVLGLIGESRVAAPWLEVGDRLAKDLADLGLQPDDPSVSRIGSALDELCACPSEPAVSP